MDFEQQITHRRDRLHSVCARFTPSVEQHDTTGDWRPVLMSSNVKCSTFTTTAVLARGRHQHNRLSLEVSPSLLSDHRSRQVCSCRAQEEGQCVAGQFLYLIRRPNVKAWSSPLVSTFASAT